MTELSLEGLECGYGAQPILRGVSLQLKGGEILGVLGPNGSGKSTLVRAASRVLKPKLGRVLLDGTDLYSIPPRQSARSLAVVSQETPLDFAFTCFEVVLLGRSPHLGPLESESSKDRDIARASMERTGTWPLRDRLFGDLSGGERQRVILARAFTQEPRVLLLDEPTSHLDVRYQIEILELVRSLCREKGTAVLCVLHDLNLAMNFCTSGMLLNEGRVVAAGRWEEVLTPARIREVFGVEAEVRDRRVLLRYPS